MLLHHRYISNHPQKRMQTHILGKIQHLQKENNVLIIKTKEAEARIWVYSDEIIRINISRNFDEADPSFAVIQKPSAKIDLVETDDEIELKTSALKLRIQKKPITF